MWLGANRASIACGFLPSNSGQDIIKAGNFCASNVRINNPIVYEIGKNAAGYCPLALRKIVSGIEG
jgi:hypothetical protein